MAGLWDRFLGFLGFEEEPEDDVVEPAAGVAAAQAGGSGVGGASASGWRPHDDGTLAVAARRSARAARLAAWQEERAEARAAGVARGANVTRLHPGLPGLVVAAPKRFEDAQEIADHLRSGKPVILHGEGLERDLAQRLVHFLMGATYALGGEMHRVGSVVLFAPAGVDVTLPFTLRLAEREGR